MVYPEYPPIKIYEKYPHIGRMLKEANDLEDRIIKLRKYIESHYSELTPVQRELMFAQLKAMGEYHAMLAERVKYDTRYYYKKVTGQEE